MLNFVLMALTIYIIFQLINNVLNGELFNTGILNTSDIWYLFIGLLVMKFMNLNVKCFKYTKFIVAIVFALCRYIELEKL